MIKKIILLTILLFSTATIFANEEFTTWKCAIYPKSNSPFTGNYAIIQFNEQEAIKYTYFRLYSPKPSSLKFSLLKTRFKFYRNSKNTPATDIYIDSEEEGILAIDRERHLASYASVTPMPDNINAKYKTVFGKQYKLLQDEKTGVFGYGYYCNINQDTKLPDSEGIINASPDDTVNNKK